MIITSCDYPSAAYSTRGEAAATLARRFPPRSMAEALSTFDGL